MLQLIRATYASSNSNVPLDVTMFFIGQIAYAGQRTCLQDSRVPAGEQSALQDNRVACKIAK